MTGKSHGLVNGIYIYFIGQHVPTTNAVPRWEAVRRPMLSCREMKRMHSGAAIASHYVHVDIQSLSPFPSVRCFLSNRSSRGKYGLYPIA